MSPVDCLMYLLLLRSTFISLVNFGSMASICRVLTLGFSPLDAFAVASKDVFIPDIQVHMFMCGHTVFVFLFETRS